ncbi:MAG TPA: orotidine-5'-phosphate decarboxylase [Candidatus Paceibacterota bacterium]
MKPEERIIVALDTPTVADALRIAKELEGLDCLYKMNALYHVLFPVFKEGLVREKQEAEKLLEIVHGKLFLDLKFSDIPSTVAASARSIKWLEPKMFNTHANAGLNAMKAAVENKGTAMSLAVTVLSSLKPSESEFIFGEIDIPKKVCSFAQSAIFAGMDGIVCSPQELGALKRYRAFDGLVRVVAGSRSSWAPTNDQKRPLTPAQAINLDADYLVIGRQVTNPPQEIGGVRDAFLKTVAEIKAA